MSDKQIGIGWTTDSNLIPPIVVSQPIHVTNSTSTFTIQDVTRPTGLQIGRPLPGFRVNGSDVSQSAISSLLSSPTHSSISSLPITPTRKRKLSLDEVASFKKKLTETDAVRLKKVQSTYAERCAIQCFLHNNGLPAEYAVWRSHLPFNPLANFLRVNKLKPEDETEDLYSVLKSSSLITAPPIRPPSSDSSSRLSSPLSSPVGNQVFDKRLAKPVKSTLVTQGIASPTKIQDGLSTTSSQEQIVERAKQEAYVMQRITELQRDGLWSEKRLPKVFELPRPKAHWDYVLEEMTWLAADFAQERKWKKAAARKCAYMVQKHFREKELAAQQADKEKELHLRKIAATIAKGVRDFWSNIERLVNLKQEVLMKTKQKKALDHRLNLLIDSSLVAKQASNNRPSLKKAPLDHNVDCIMKN